MTYYLVLFSILFITNILLLFFLPNLRKQEKICNSSQNISMLKAFERAIDWKLVLNVKSWICNRFMIGGELYFLLGLTLNDFERALLLAKLLLSPVTGTRISRYTNFL